MQAFEYANPATVREAVGMLGARWGEVDVLAGGTDLLSLMKEHIETPRRVVNIKNIKELGGIKKHGVEVRIGAAVTLDELERNPDIRRSYPVLAEAARGAKIRLVSASGSREVDAAKFFVTPQNADSREIALLPNELVTEIVLPATDTHSATYEVRQKEALDWPLATASVVLNMTGDTVSSARIVLGHVAPTPWVAAEAQTALAGKTVTQAVAADAGKAALEGATPLSQNRYKVQLARVAVKRALLMAAIGKV